MSIVSKKKRREKRRVLLAAAKYNAFSFREAVQKFFMYEYDFNSDEALHAMFPLKEEKVP